MPAVFRVALVALLYQVDVVGGIPALELLESPLPGEGPVREEHSRRHPRQEQSHPGASAQEENLPARLQALGGGRAFLHGMAGQAARRPQAPGSQAAVHHQQSQQTHRQGNHHACHEPSLPRET